MFRRFPVFQRLISWTKPQAPVEPGSREYEWYDHNSLLADEPGHRALIREFMDRSFDVPAREEMEMTLREFVARAGIEARFGCAVERVRREGEEQLALETTHGDYRCRADDSGLVCVNYAHQSAVRFAAAGIQPFGCLKPVPPPDGVGAAFGC